MYKFDYIALSVAVALLLGTILTAVYVNRSPITITQATEHCVIIEQAGFREVRCIRSTNINTDIPDERE